MSQNEWEKVGLRKPSATDEAEHSAVGDVSTGRRFKAVQAVPNAVILDESVAGTTYIGESKPGTLTSSPLWRVKKMVETSSITTITFADGNDQFDNIWDNRASLSYS